MGEEYLREIGPLFEAVVDLPEPRRRAYLDLACAGRAELRRAVESLLKADAEDPVFLDRSALDLLAEDISSQDPPSASPREPARRAQTPAPGRCDRGHLFDRSKYAHCPLCGAAHPDMPQVRPIPAPPALAPLSQRVAIFPDPAGAKQQPRLPVGWLVCIEGPDYGRDFRIVSGRNLIGRDAGMSVCLANDSTIAEKLHAVITHDPAANTFWIEPGGGGGKTCLNGFRVEKTTALKAHDTLELGRTFLRFVPFCGESFRWPAKSSDHFSRG